MRRRLLGFLALVFSGFIPCLAQQPIGKVTLETVVATKEPETPDCPEGKLTDAGSARLAGALARPKNGFQHPELDKAWAKYDAAIAKASEGIRTGIGRLLERATTKGDLNAVEKWQKALKKFEESGEVPPEDEANKFVNSAVAERDRATEILSKAYDNVVRVLTMGENFGDAARARDERNALKVVRQKKEEDEQKKIKPKPKPDPQDTIKQAVVGVWDSAGFTWRFGADGSIKVEGWGEGVWHVMADGTIRVSRRNAQRPEEFLTDVLKFVEPGMMERTDGQVFRKK